MVAEKAWSGIRKLIGAGAKKASSAASSFVDVTKSALPHVPVISSRVLASAMFAPSSEVATGNSPASAPKAASLVAAYRQRTDEIRSQTMYDATGTPVMRPQARQEMATRLAAIAAGSPMLADHIETVDALQEVYAMPPAPMVGGLYANS